MTRWQEDAAARTGRAGEWPSLQGDWALTRANQMAMAIAVQHAKTLHHDSETEAPGAGVRPAWLVRCDVI